MEDANQANILNIIVVKLIVSSAYKLYTTLQIVLFCIQYAH